MKRISFVVLSFAALMLLMLASCSKQQGAATLIPDDAFIVMRLDVMQGMEKSGLKGDNSDMKKWIEEQIKEAGLDKELSDKMLQILDDPTKSGIDFTEPAFIYVSTDFGKKVEGGFVANMASESDLTNLLKTLEDMDFPGVEKKDGVNYVELGDETAIIYCDDWFFGGATDDVTETIATLKERASGKGSLSGNKALEVMCNKTGVAQILFQLSAFNNIKDRDTKMALMMAEKALPEGVKLEDMASVTDFQLNKGETLITTEGVMLSSKAQEYFEENLKMLKPIVKEQAKFISDKALSLFVNLDMKKFEEYIEKMKDIYEIDDEDMEDVKKVFGTLDGTLALDLYGISDNGPMLSAYLGTKDNSLLSEAKEEMFNGEAKEVAADEYLVPTDYDYDWDADDNFVMTPKAWGVMGFKDGLTYFSGEAENAFKAPATEYPFGNVKGCGFFARFNFSIFKDYLKNVEDDDEARMVMQAVGDIFDYAELYADKDGKGIFRIANKDNNKTLIEAISDYAKKFLN